jgi:hypothetical protein
VATAWKQTTDELSLTWNVLQSVIDDGFAKADLSSPVTGVAPQEISRG